MSNLHRACAHRPPKMVVKICKLLQVATNIVASLLAMEAMNDSEDIKLYINSPGTYSCSAPLIRQI